MPDKQKDSKIMSMLERRGIIRRADGDGPDGSPADAAARTESDIKPLFYHQDETVVVKTAPRQPVPGMTTPVFPSEKEPPAGAAAPAPAPAPARFSEPVATYAPPKPAPAPAPPAPPAPAPSPYRSPEAPPPAPAPVPTPAPYAEPPKPASTFGGLGLFKNGNAPAEQPPAETYSRDGEPRPENYTDRYLNVSELYEALALRSKKTDTIYLIEEYLETLPGSLPDSQRREIVSRLLAASGFDFDLLMGDGVLRVKMLKEYAERFARHTDDYIAARQSELEELDQQILRTRRLIDNRKELHKKQFYTIEAEAQRLKEILTFISG